MRKLADTLSVCDVCYRHVPAIRFERDSSIWLSKTCKVHGEQEHLVEPNAEFYLAYKYPKKDLTSYFIETTNRCNLTCPHCYQEPDNKSKDPSIDYLLSIIKSWPDDGLAVALVGAEPTVRKDLPDLIRGIQSLPGKPRSIMILSNGVYLSKPEYAEQFVEFENLTWTIGLNHPDYNGHSVRDKQIQGINNCLIFGLPIKNISYTLEDLSQVEYCLDEIQEFYPSRCEQFRIRVGSDIGRNPEGEKIYLSQLVDKMLEISKERGWSVETDFDSGIQAHYPLIINGVYVKAIQWPDATTLDMSELQTEAIADILPGKPRSPLVHQVILRDAAVNNKMPLYDTLPEEFNYITMK